jgi:hypothetical protein
MSQPKLHPTNFQGNIYPKIASELSGDVGDLDKWQEGQEQHQHLLEQSHWVARQLVHEGIEAYIEQDLTLIGLHTRQAKRIPNFRNINFIPYVAKKNRRKQCKELNYYLEKNPNCRLWTITTGTRCNSNELNTRVRALHRRVSRINSEPFMKEAGATFVYRATEFGEVAPLGTADLSFHPHCHALLKLSHYLQKDKWSILLSKIQAYLGAYSQDNGRVKNPRELVKYCVKPSDLEHLNSAQIKTLYESTQGLRLCESLQEFRKLRGQIREEKLKVVLRKGTHKLVPSWNQGHAHEEIPLYLQDPEVRDREVTPSVLAWCVPARVFTPVTEPVFLVHGLQHRDPASVFAWPEVIEMERSIKVHTEMLTVRNKTSRKERIHESKSKVYTQTSPPT